MMSEEKGALMTRYGITSTTKAVYFYKQYRYDHFEDALRSAKLDTEHVDDNVGPRIAIENPE